MGRLRWPSQRGNGGVVDAVWQGAALSDNDVEEKTPDDPHKLLDINLDE